MALTDQEIMLLEQWSYLNNDVQKIAGVTMTGTSLGEMLEAFDEEALRRLEAYDGNPKVGGIDPQDVSGFMSGKEWAALIRAMKADQNLCDLKYCGYNDEVFASCFLDEESGEAYVSFRGTSGGREWKDDVEGLNEYDTACQKEALDYIEGLPYENITVVGHSKGGNKAQYVTITSDKVKRCISMDGQGFSQEFMDKYAMEISQKGHCIKNYSLSNDYVHILLFPIPGAEQIYCQGADNFLGIRTHCPGAFFQFLQDENGSWQLQYDANGQVNLIPTKENEGLTYLHEFTCFLLNSMPNDKKAKITEYLSYALALAMDEEYVTDPINGKRYTHSELGDYILSDKESMIILIAYVMKYAEINSLSEKEIMELLKWFGLDEYFKNIQYAVKAYARQHPIQGLAMEIGKGSIMAILNFFYKQLTDGKSDPVIETILKWADQHLDLDVELYNTWTAIEREYSQIEVENPKAVIKDATVPSGRKWDYTFDSYSRLMTVINSIEKSTSVSVSSWNQYAQEDWYSGLGIQIAIRGINGYFDHLSEINTNCLTQIEQIYEDVQTIDSAKANLASEGTERLKTATDDILSMRDSIHLLDSITLMTQTLLENRPKILH